MGVSAISLLELAAVGRKRSRIQVDPHEFLTRVRDYPEFQVIPFTIEMAFEAVSLVDAFPDPADRAIVATALDKRLRLVTSDQRIIESRLVPVIA
jgi:PIN domain nuclease of toxin-antitoxin system